MKYFLILFFFNLLACIASSAENVRFKKAVLAFDQKDYVQAIINAEAALTQTPIAEHPPTYYLLGLAQTEMQFFDSALANLEIAQDLSQDNILDVQIDTAIDKAIRRQFLYEKNKKRNSLSLTLGASYDSNVLNLNPSGFPTEDLKTLSALYGFTYSRKAINDVDRSLIPEFNFQDNYSTNSSLASNSTIQSNDALIWSFTIPYISYHKIVNPNDYAKFQLIYQNIYLPSTGSKRSLTYVSTGLSNEYLLNFSNWYVLIPGFGLFSDSSQSVNSIGDNDASATRLNFKFLNLFNLNRAGSKRLNLKVEYTNNNARGKNVFYNRFVSGLGYNFDWIGESLLNLELKYQISDYPRSDVSRTDKVTGVDFEASKQLSDSSRLGSLFSVQTTYSSNSTYKYDDYSLTVFYNKSFDF